MQFFDNIMIFIKIILYYLIMSQSNKLDVAFIHPDLGIGGA
jgi:hypothetical protein